jgi:hypothetical protein
MNKRRAAIQAALASKNSAKPTKVPSMPSGDMDSVSEAKIDVELNYSKLSDSLDKAGISFSDFLQEHSGIVLSKPERKLTTPSGEVYTVVTSYMSYEQLKELCVIDSDNVRDISERTEEALADIIDEIGMGLQLMPIFAYVDNNGKHSIMEGSRRFASALHRKVGLTVDIFDCKPNLETIRWVVETSDRKKGFSYYEKGKLYTKLMETHIWTQAELERERGYTQQDISLSIAYYSSPTPLLELLPVKTLPQAYVLKLNSATKAVLNKNLLNETIEDLKEVMLDIETVSLDKQSKMVVDKWHELAKKLSAKKTKSVTPVFESGETKAFVKRTKKGSHITLQGLPRDLEKDVLEAIEKLVNGSKSVSHL